MAQVLVNGETRDLAATTIEALLRAERIDPSARGLAVALNGAVVSRDVWAGTAVAEGDRVEIVKPFSGG